MGLPLSWTESSLIGEMEGELEAVAEPLDLNSKDLIARSVQKDVPEVLGVTSVADATYASIADVIKVLTIARWRAWERAYQVTLSNFRLKAGSAELYRSEAWEHLKDYLAEVRATAMRYSEVRTYAPGSGGSRQAVPVTGALTTTAPVTPCWPPDGNDPIYSGSPYSRR